MSRPVSSDDPWLGRFAAGVVVLAAVAALVAVLGRWAIDAGRFAAVDAFAFDVPPHHPLTRFFVAVTFFGTSVGIAAVCLIMLVALLWRGAFRGAAALFCCVLTAAYANDWVKEWVARERPVHAGIVEAPGYSFLSGHAFVGTAVYGLIALLLMHNVDRPRRRFLLAAFTVLFVALLGFSRIYLGVHYTSDVIAGFLLGIVWIIVWNSVFRPAPARRFRR